MLNGHPKTFRLRLVPPKRTLPYQTVCGDGTETTGKIVEAYALGEALRPNTLIERADGLIE